MKNTLLLTGLCLAFAGEAAYARCRADELTLRWPMNGTDGKDYVINNYADLDPGDGLKDFRDNTGNAAKTYNGHQGIDIDLANFRRMDAGYPVVAAADGVVESIQGNLFDRNMEGAPGCGDWNHVYVRHSNGFLTMYGHLKQNSIKVRKGQSVVAGQELGLIGSSGCSSVVHLHFEVRDCSDTFVDPMLQGMFSDAPQYDTDLNVMDITVRKGGFPDGAIFTPVDVLLKDPGRNINSITAGTRIGVGLSVAGGNIGDKINVVLKNAAGKIETAFAQIDIDGAWRHSWPRWWANIPRSASPREQWKVEVYQNDSLVKSHSFAIQATRDAIFQGLAQQTYQHTFQSMLDADYSPVWVDGSGEAGQGAKISAIYRHNGGKFRTIHDATGEQYQNAFMLATGVGLQLLQIDSYLVDGQPRIAAVFGTKWSPGWQAYHFVTRDEHLKRFNELRAQGMRPYAITVAVANGREYVSAAYSNVGAGEWAAFYGLTAAAYQQEFERQKAKGLFPMFLDVYDDNGTPKFSAIWTADAGKKQAFARHNLSELEFFQFNEERAIAGMPIRAISSYIDNGRRLYAGLWSAD